MVIRIPKGPGSREDRFTHLLCGEVDVSATLPQVKANSTAKTGQSSRLDELEHRVEQLEAQIKQLMGQQD